MASKNGRTWEVPERDVTPEHVYLKRREFMRQGSLLLAGLGVGSLWRSPANAKLAYPATANPTYKAIDPTRPLTKPELATSYNNFYEFSLEKSGVKPLAEKWKIPTPWRVEVGGLVEESKSYDFEDLVKMAGGLEERIYRFRCVEGWSMVVPWTGFPLAKLIPKLKPKAGAKFVSFTSYANEKDFPNIKGQPHYPWPYREGLRLDEANHELTFMATGLYGKPLPRQNGAPIRLVVPWKYGFKSIKSVVRIDLTTEQPKTLWNQMAPDEYGFYANVNPEVPHPRWSQESERILDGKLFPTRVKTLKFNGYEKEVAGLYKGLDLKKNY